MKGRFLDAVIAAGHEARSVALATGLKSGAQLLFDGGEFTAQRCQNWRFSHLQAGVDHSGGLKLFNYLLVLDSRFLLYLIEIKQFFPW